MRWKTLVSGLIASSNPVMAHSGSQHHMMEPLGHGTGNFFMDAMGYGMWGMGWYSALLGLTFWTLLVLGTIYLFQQVNSRGGENGAE